MGRHIYHTGECGGKEMNLIHCTFRGMLGFAVCLNKGVHILVFDYVTVGVITTRAMTHNFSTIASDGDMRQVVFGDCMVAWLIIFPPLLQTATCAARVRRLHGSMTHHFIPLLQTATCGRSCSATVLWTLPLTTGTKYTTSPCERCEISTRTATRRWLSTSSPRTPRYPAPCGTATSSRTLRYACVVVTSPRLQRNDHFICCEIWTKNFYYISSHIYLDFTQSYWFYLHIIIPIIIVMPALLSTFWSYIWRYIK